MTSLVTLAPGQTLKLPKANTARSVNIRMEGNLATMSQQWTIRYDIFAVETKMMIFFNKRDCIILFKFSSSLTTEHRMVYFSLGYICIRPPCVVVFAFKCGRRAGCAGDSCEPRAGEPYRYSDSPRARGVCAGEGRGLPGKVSSL